MKYNSVFDIIGPVMMGPSSSHTAGAARIGRLARRLFGAKPDQVVMTLYESFAKTYHGHGTDLALVGGLLDLDTDDQRIQEAFQLAQQQGVHITLQVSEESADHPNTVRLLLQKDSSASLEIVGISIGGGKVEIIEVNGFPVHITGDWPTLFILHEDRFGVIASVTQLLKKSKINIGYMEMSRKEKGSHALMILEMDQPLSDILCKKIEKIPNVHRVSFLDPHTSTGKGPTSHGIS